MQATVKDIVKELAAHPEATFVDLLPFNEFAFSAVAIQGQSPIWEMHPDTDEWFYVIAGTLEIQLLFEDTEQTLTVNAGKTTVVPKTVWHKLNSIGLTQFIYHTPGTSLHSDASDPRKGG